MKTALALINLAFVLYSRLLLAYIILSWIPHNRYNLVVKKINQLTEPYLNIFRSLGLNFGGIDFSPIAAFFALSIMQQLVVNMLAF